MSPIGSSPTLFCLQMSFTAFAQLRLPQVAEAFTHLGFPAYFRVELSLAKLLGVVLILAPLPARLKEWAYAGFAIDLASALIAHLSVGDGPESWGWAVATGVLWALVHLWRRLRRHLQLRGEGLTVHRSLFRSQKREEAAARSLPSTPAAEHHHAIRARIAHGPLGQDHIRDVAIVMHCELPLNRKRRPLVEVAGYAKRSENRCENRSYT